MRDERGSRADYTQAPWYESASLPVEPRGSGLTLSPVAVLPEQFFRSPRGQKGETAFMRAVLQDAFACVAKQFVKNGPYAHRLAREAEEWFFAEDERWPGVTQMANTVPWPSQAKCTLVPQPPCERPGAWSGGSCRRSASGPTTCGSGASFFSRPRPPGHQPPLAASTVPLDPERGVNDFVLPRAKVTANLFLRVGQPRQDLAGGHLCAGRGRVSETARGEREERRDGRTRPIPPLVKCCGAGRSSPLRSKALVPTPSPLVSCRR